MSTEADVVVVGAGVIGLATAAALARCGRSVIVVERNLAIAQEISARNSEVIHAGIYYPADSLKATLCIAGRMASLLGSYQVEVEGTQNLVLDLEEFNARFEREFGQRL